MMLKNFILAAAMILVFPENSDARTSSEERIQYVSEQLSLGSEVSLAGAILASTHIIPDLYADRAFKPAWIDDDQIDEFVRLVGRAEEEGLDPADYYESEIRILLGQYRADRDNDNLRAEVDVLLTESLSRHGYHLIFGKVDPTDFDKNWNWSRGSGGRDPVALVQQAIDSESIETFIEKLLERGPVYDRMKAILAEYRALKMKGGWPQVAPGHPHWRTRSWQRQLLPKSTCPWQALRGLPRSRLGCFQPPFGQARFRLLRGAQEESQACHVG